MYVYKFMHMFRYVHMFLYAHVICAYCVHLDCRNQLLEILALGLGCKPIVDSTNHCEILFETRLARRRGEIYIIQMHNVHLPRCVPMHSHWYIARLFAIESRIVFCTDLYSLVPGKWDSRWLSEGKLAAKTKSSRFLLEWVCMRVYVRVFKLVWVCLCLCLSLGACACVSERDRARPSECECVCVRKRKWVVCVCVCGCKHYTSCKLYHLICV